MPIAQVQVRSQSPALLADKCFQALSSLAGARRRNNITETARLGDLSSVPAGCPSFAPGAHIGDLDEEIWSQ
jgi:hypothetical protein